MPSPLCRGAHAFSNSMHAPNLGESEFLDPESQLGSSRTMGSDLVLDVVPQHGLVCPLRVGLKQIFLAPMVGRG